MDATKLSGLTFTENDATLRYIYPQDHWAAGWIMKLQDADNNLWITWRRATPEDIERINAAVADAHHVDGPEGSNCAGINVHTWQEEGKIPATRPWNEAEERARIEAITLDDIPAEEYERLSTDRLVSVYWANEDEIDNRDRELAALVQEVRERR